MKCQRRVNKKRRGIIIKRAIENGRGKPLAKLMWRAEYAEEERKKKENK